MGTAMKWSPVWIGVAGVVAVVWYVQSRPSDAPARAPRVAETAFSPAATEQDQPVAVPQQPPEVVQAVSVTAPTRERSAPLDEGSLMNTLRGLKDTAPERSLQLAREGNQRFPDSPDAAERGWYVCRSLVDLEDFYDAREEARAMVAKYRGTEWATDIERHLLVNPLDLPGDPAPGDSAP
jgi:hypothetical protein